MGKYISHSYVIARKRDMSVPTTKNVTFSAFIIQLPEHSAVNRTKCRRFECLVCTPYVVHGIMKTSSDGSISRVTGYLWCEVTDHKGQWCGSAMFSLIRAWTHIWANNRDAGDLRRHRAHYDVTLMQVYTFYIEKKNEFLFPGKKACQLPTLL